MVHAVKIAEEKSSLGTAKILAANFNKVSKEKEKPNSIRYFVMTKEQFSYYLTEDHYNYSEDLAIMRFWYSDVAEVVFKVNNYYQTKEEDSNSKYHLIIYLGKCYKDKRNLTQQILKMGFSSYSSQN